MHTTNTLTLSGRTLWVILMIGVVVVVMVAGTSSYVNAQADTPALPVGNGAGTPPKQEAPHAGDASLPDPLKAKSFGELLKSVAELVRDLGFYAGVIFILYSGLLFITARGNEDKLTKAKDVFKWTIIGMFIIMGSSIMVNAIVNTVKSL